MKPAASFLVRLLASAVGLSLLAAGVGWLPLRPVLIIAAVAVVLAAGEGVVAAWSGRASGGRKPASRQEAIVDTSALIDARLVAIAEAGFLVSTLVCPTIVLRELQALADSGDAGRRARGHRGLDALRALQESSRVQLVVLDDAPEGDTPVDGQLVRIAVARKAALVTTDFALNKLASARGVAVLNVNDLAHAVRPVVLPGEHLHVTIVKEGKEPGQGIAYLDDGTMIVVEQGRTLIGRTLDVTVTSAIQTAAGKMLFAKTMS